jgi:hypothetical protein
MTSAGEMNDDIAGTISRLNEQVDTAVGRTVDLHHAGASEEAVLAETAVAVGAAKALEVLTGEDWETVLERREAGLDLPDGAPGDSRPPPRRWSLRHRG